MPNQNVFSLEHSDSHSVVRLLDCLGSLSDHALLDEVRDVATQLEHRPTAGVVVDLGQVPYFGSYLLEALNTIWSGVAARNGKMALCNVSPVGTEILKLAKFDQRWPLVETVEQARSAILDQPHERPSEPA